MGLPILFAVGFVIVRTVVMLIATFTTVGKLLIVNSCSYIGFSHIYNKKYYIYGGLAKNTISVYVVFFCFFYCFAWVSFSKISGLRQVWEAVVFSGFSLLLFLIENSRNGCFFWFCISLSYSYYR